MDPGAGAAAWKWSASASDRLLTPIDFTAPKLEESSCHQHPMGDERWREVLSDFRSKLQTLDRVRTKYLERAIRERIEWLDPIMTWYCRLTCGECPDPCCHARKIFFNRTDMLYLACSDLPAPPGQTRTQAGNPCRYLGVDGCGLSRTGRPYVCVWFLCEPQMELLQHEPVGFQRQLAKVMGEIRSCRLLLEATFEAAFPEAPAVVVERL